MVKRIRNKGCLPFINSEGTFIQPVTKEVYKKDVPCHPDIFQRLYRHHTLASIRNHSFFKPTPGLIPKDQLEFVLASRYNQTEEAFPDTIDVYLQPETLGEETWRRLRNTRDLTPDREELAAQAEKENAEKRRKAAKMKGKKVKPVIPYRYNFAHKVLIGGVTDRKHPSYIKLMNSSHHSPQTNPGYSRQPADGTFFQY